MEKKMPDKLISEIEKIITTAVREWNDKQTFETIQKGALKIAQFVREKIPERKEHFAILSNKDLIPTLIEGRTIKDWIKYGYNQAIQDFKERLG